METNFIQQNQEDWLNEVLKSNKNLKPVSPKRNLFLLIEQRIEVRKKYLPKSVVLGIAASLLIILFLNIILVSKYQDSLEKSLNSFSDYNITNQIY